VTIALAGEGAAAAPAVDATAAGNAADEDTLRWNDEGGAIPAVAAAATGIPVPEAGALLAGRVQATPAVRQLAKQMGVALESLAGSGPGGAITADDVKRAAAGAKAAGPATSRAGTPAAGPGAERASVPAASSAPAAKAGASGPASYGLSVSGEQRVPLRGLRRRIAEHMRLSLDTA